MKYGAYVQNQKVRHY